MTRPLASVVVPTREGRRLLPACLEALRAQTLAAREVIVVDNGSSDGSRELLAADHPEVAVVALPDNRGFAAAVNAGARRAGGAYLALLNDDAVPAPDWLAELVACLERHPRAAAADSRVLDARDPRIVDGAGLCLTRSLKAYRRGRGDADAARYARERQVFGASGTACLWRRDAFDALGGFDERFFAFYEDVDLSFRARAAGWEIWYAPRAVARHEGGATALADRAALEARLAARNRWLTIAKNVPPRWLALHAPVILAGEVAGLAAAAATGEARALLAGYREAVSLGALDGGARHAGPGALREVRGLFPPLRMSLRRPRGRRRDQAATGAARSSASR